jgi:ubiquitin-conjugating enzyme E2 variant
MPRATAEEAFSEAGTAMAARLPAHYEVTRRQRVLSAVAIATAFLALAVVGIRVAARADVWHWWAPLALLAGIAAADFGSGLVHWGADTWGRDDLPLIGHRLLVPFRVHHINPDDFLRRSFVDTNGDVALLGVPLLAGLFFLPLDTGWRAATALFGLSFCGVGMMTNQIHQWAHMPSPPFAVRLLQRAGLLLGRAEHATHHARPYDAHYCITTGWCNRPLEAIGFFRGLESVITRLTGARPRHDDERYEERYGVA